MTDAIRWMLDSIARTDDTNNQCMFQPVRGSRLQQKGESTGVAMMFGLLAMSIIATNRSRRISIKAATDT